MGCPVTFQYKHMLYNVEIRVSTSISPSIYHFFLMKTFEILSCSFSEIHSSISFSESPFCEYFLWITYKMTQEPALSKVWRTLRQKRWWTHLNNYKFFKICNHTCWHILAVKVEISVSRTKSAESGFKHRLFLLSDRWAQPANDIKGPLG